MLSVQGRGNSVTAHNELTKANLIYQPSSVILNRQAYILHSSTGGGFSMSTLSLKRGHVIFLLF